MTEKWKFSKTFINFGQFVFIHCNTFLPMFSNVKNVWSFISSCVKLDRDLTDRQTDREKGEREKKGQNTFRHVSQVLIELWRKQKRQKDFLWIMKRKKPDLHMNKAKNKKEIKIKEREREKYKKWVKNVYAMFSVIYANKISFRVVVTRTFSKG